MDSNNCQRVLFIGNSPNLLIPSNAQYSWNNMLSNMEKNIRDDIGHDDVQDEGMPFAARVVRLKNFYAGKANKGFAEAETKINSWLRELVQLPTGHIHELIKNLVNDFSSIITTNYDYSIELAVLGKIPDAPVSGGKAVNSTRCHGSKVWHIHGEAMAPESIILSSVDYLDAAYYLKDADNKEGTWLNEFLHSEVFICGFNAYFEESLFWYALQRRMLLSEKERKRVVFYQFVEKGKEKYCDQIHSLLRSYSVDVEKIYVHHGFEVAWFEVVGRLFAAVNNVRRLDEEANIKSAEQNVVTQVAGIIRTVCSKSATSGNPERCWMNIPLDAFSEQGNIAFICTIEGERYEYKCSSRKLKSAFESAEVKIMRNEPVRYSFYLDYKTGEIFKTISPNDQQPVILLFSSNQHYSA